MTLSAFEVDYVADTLIPTLADTYRELWRLVPAAGGPTDGRSASRPAEKSPINVGVLDFLHGRWEDEQHVWHDGLAPAVLQLEQLTRRALGLPERTRDRAGWPGIGLDPRVTAAASWLRTSLPQRPLDDDLEADLDELQAVDQRAECLLGRASSMLRWQNCPTCGNRSIVRGRQQWACLDPGCSDTAVGEAAA